MINEQKDSTTESQLRDAKGNKTNAKVLRQERTKAIPEDMCYIKVKEDNFNVLDYSLYGISILSNKAFTKDQNLEFIPFHFKDKLVGEYELSLVRCEKMDASLFKTVFKLCDEELPIEKIHALKVATEFEQEHSKRVQKLVDVPESFQCMVYEVKDLLLRLKDDMEEKEQHLAFDCLNEQNTFYEIVAENVGKALSDYFQPIYEKFANEFIERLSEEQLKVCFRFFQDQLHDLITESRFASKSIQKPRGYAGDFNMMNLLYYNQPLGNSMFSKAIHKYYMAHPNAKAVRNRSLYLYNHLRKFLENSPKGSTIKILSLASGPARELQMLIEKYHNEINERQIEVTLCDLDTDALMHSQRVINKLLRKTDCQMQVTYLKQNILKLRKEGICGDKTTKYDFIYSAGVFDYIKDAAASVIVEYLYERLSENGTIIIGNFSMERSCAALMHLALDWNLLYRTKKDLYEMFEFIDPNLKIEKEEEGINLFAVLKK